jgi:hypothetical protein
MKYRIAALIPILCAGIVAAVEFSSPTTEALRALWKFQVPAVKLLGFAGCMLAASRFSRGDYLRRAWFFTGMCYFLLLTKDVFFGAGSHFQQPHTFSLTVQYARGGITLLANFSNIYGTWLLARTWRVAGIALPGSDRGRLALMLAAVVVSLSIAGQATWVDVSSVVRGDMGELVGVASDVGDIVSLVLLAPVMLTAIALRGGLLWWPWALLTLSNMGWLLYDGTATFGHFIGAEPIQLRALEEIFRAMACTAALGAGLAQRWTVDRKVADEVSGPRAASGG